MFLAWTEFAGGSPNNREVHLSGATFCVNGAVGPADPAARMQMRAVPNPFHSSVTIRLESALGESGLDGGMIGVRIFDAVRRFVRFLDGRRDAIPAGVYWARVETGAGAETARLTLR